MKIVVFDIWGDFGHFRVPYTTSSPLTFPVPPKPAIYGIIGAILGYDKNEYLEIFQKQKWQVAIGIKNRISKTYIPENFINTKEVKLFARMPKGKSCRTQINLEFVKNPEYRIYVTCESSDLERLMENLIQHKTIYTICLGLSECIANFNFIGCFQGKICSSYEKEIKIHSILPLKLLDENFQINFFQEGMKFLKTRMPVEMSPDRELLKVDDFIIEANGYPVEIRLKNYIKIEKLNENIVMF